MYGLIWYCLGWLGCLNRFYKKSSLFFWSFWCNMNVCYVRKWYSYGFSVFIYSKYWWDATCLFWWFCDHWISCILYVWSMWLGFLLFFKSLRIKFFIYSSGKTITSYFILKSIFNITSIFCIILNFVFLNSSIIQFPHIQ